MSRRLCAGTRFVLHFVNFKEGLSVIRTSLCAKSFLGLVLALGGLVAHAADKVTVQLKWVPQAQFAGYYMAAAKGFYTEAGLDVTIKPGGLDIAPIQVIAAKQADIVVDWMPSALAARESGVPLVNVSQVFNQSGLMLTCKKSSGVMTPSDLRGKTLGVWFGGNEYPFLNWMSKLGLKTNSDIKVLKQGFSVAPLLQNQAACISTMSYNEYWQLVDAGVNEKELVTFLYEKLGVATMEDGLYVLEDNLKDSAFVVKMGKFLKATLKGWDAAVKDPEGAAKVVVAADTTGMTNLKTQKRQMENVAKLITNAGTKKIGYLEPAAYERTVKVLLAGGSDPVIKKDPGKAAYTHVIWDAAQK
jgi:NitT/TauT family transport system substrate-binding protein